jgi:hypothetical protein
MLGSSPLLRTGLAVGVELLGYAAVAEAAIRQALRPKCYWALLDELYRPQNAGVALNRRHFLRSVFATAIWSRACQPVTVPMAR